MENKKVLATFFGTIFLGFLILQLITTQGFGGNHSSLLSALKNRFFTKEFHLAVVPNLSARTVSIIDTKLNQETTRISLADEPMDHVAMSPDGRYAYIGTERRTGATPPSYERIYKIDLNTKQSLGPLNSFPAPLQNRYFQDRYIEDLEISPNGKYLIASTWTPKIGTVATVDVYVINPTNDTLISTFTFAVYNASYSRFAGVIAFSDNSRYAFFPITDPSSVTTIKVLDLTQGTIINELPIANWNQDNSFMGYDLKWQKPFLLALRHYSWSGVGYDQVRKYDSSQGYVYQDVASIMTSVLIYQDIELLGDGKVAVSDNAYDPADYDSITIIDLRSNTTSLIPAEAEAAMHLTYDKRTNRIWAICSPPFVPGYFCDDLEPVTQAINVYDLNQMRKIKRVPAGTRFTFPSLSQDGSYFYAVDAVNDSVIVVNTETFQVSSIRVGDNPRGIYMQGPEGNKVKEVIGL